MYGTQFSTYSLPSDHDSFPSLVPTLFPLIMYDTHFTTYFLPSDHVRYPVYFLLSSL